MKIAYIAAIAILGFTYLCCQNQFVSQLDSWMINWSIIGAANFNKLMTCLGMPTLGQILFQAIQAIDIS